MVKQPLGVSSLFLGAGQCTVCPRHKHACHGVRVAVLQPDSLLATGCRRCARALESRCGQLFTDLLL